MNISLIAIVTICYKAIDDIRQTTSCRSGTGAGSKISPAADSPADRKKLSALFNNF
ncbi:MAG: hypothetical protein LBN74_05440 [Prevotella sp.]|jgi:hypothetical protein|nr:hypothetical protein [Prevotella sp.]